MKVIVRAQRVMDWGPGVNTPRAVNSFTIAGFARHWSHLDCRITG